jgi:ribonuclease J
VRICIHRGAAQIGGSCIELEQDGQRLVLDLGLPLDADPNAPPSLPPVPGLADARAELAGVVISHAHPDHSGLLDQVSSDVPVFGPGDGKQMLDAAARFSGAEPLPAWRPLSDREPLRLGPFELTPLLVDHSAFEAYALLVEAGGRRLLYSGDLRGHGRKPGSWRRLLDDPPRPVHGLLMEGTRLNRGSGLGLSERDVEMRLAGICEETPGLVMVFYSGQNIDRLVSVFRGARRAGRGLVLDLYGALVATASQRASIPQPGFDGLHVFVPHAQRRRVIERGAFDEINAIRPQRLFPEQLAERAGELVLTMRGSMLRDVERAGATGGATAVWSMWDGYLEEPSGLRVREWLERHAIPLHQLHASGHATREQLKELAVGVGADRVIPIHTQVPEAYSSIFANVEVHQDGEWWEV